MPESDGDEMLCQFKIRKADPGHVFAKVNHSNFFYSHL